MSDKKEQTYQTNPIYYGQTVSVFVEGFPSVIHISDHMTDKEKKALHILGHPAIEAK
jgi:hypothetical protein